MCFSEFFDDFIELFACMMFTPTIQILSGSYIGKIENKTKSVFYFQIFRGLANSDLKDEEISGQRHV